MLGEFLGAPFGCPATSPVWQTVKVKVMTVNTTRYRGWVRFDLSSLQQARRCLQLRGVRREERFGATGNGLLDKAGASRHSDEDGRGESGTEGADVSFAVQSHGGRAIERAMIDDGQQAVWRQADAFQVPQHLRITIGHAAHNDRTARRHGCQRNRFAFGQRAVFPGDYVSVRVEFRVSQFLSNALFELFGNEVLQPFSLWVYFVPGIAKDLAKEELHQTVPADDTKRPSSAFVGQAGAAVLLICNTGPFRSGQFLEHAGYGRCGNAQALGNRIAGSCFTRRTAQFEDRLQVVIHRFRYGVRHS